MVLHHKYRAFVIGGQQAAGLGFVCTQLCQRLFRIAEDGDMLVALFQGDQLVALVEEKRAVRCFAHDSSPCRAG